MKFTNNVIALVMAALILTGVAIPSLHVSAFNDLNGDADVPLGYLSGDDLDGLSLRADVSGGHAYITSDLWRGPVMRNAIIVHTDKGSVYTDGSALFSLFGNTVRTYPTSVTVTIDGGSITVGDVTVPIAYAYWPDTEGFYGSYVNATLTDPIGSVGRFAGITVGGSDSQVINNTSGYVLDASVTEDGDRYGIEYVPGEYEPPVKVPPRQQAQVKPDLDLDVIEDPDIFENEEFGTIEKGEITIIPGKGEIIGDIDMEDVIVTPGKLPSGTQAVGDTTSGTTGQCTWELDGTVLYVRGSGNMGTYAVNDPAPWGTDLTDVIIEEGVLQMGPYSFYNCTRLTSVSLASTITWISSHAFHNCTALEVLELPPSLTMLNYNATQNCSSLKELICPDSLTTFGARNIIGCTSLVRVYIPPTATTISNQGTGTHFVDFDGTNLTSYPLGGGLWIRESDGTFYKSVETPTYIINWFGATVTATDNVAEVRIPYLTEYNGQTYTVKTIADGAISGSSVRYVVIPQTVESVSPTAITAPSVREILNLSDTEVTSASGRVSTEIASIATVAKKAVDDSYNTYALLIGAVVIICLVGMAVKLLPTRRVDWE